MTLFTKDTLLSLLPKIVPDSLTIPSNLPNLIHSDSRTLEAGQWFLPIKGEHFDGHEFIESCLERGASGFFYETNYASRLTTEQKKHGIEVEDTLCFFQTLSYTWRKMLKVKVIGITGSAGKTTAKEITGHLLSELGHTLVTKGSFNNELGVPLTLASLTPEHKFAVIEMGARHTGDIEFLCKYSDPDICVLLNIGTAHIGEFGSKEKLRRTKQEIFSTTRKNAIAICPADDQDSINVASQYHEKVISFGEYAGDIQVRGGEIIDGAMQLEVITPHETFKEFIGAFHKAFPINFAAAIAVCYSLDIHCSQIKSVFPTFKGLNGRFVTHQKSTYIVIDDCYNANPESMEIGLQSLSEGFQNRNYVLVLGDMLELGGVSREEHEKLGVFCAETIQPSYLVGVGPESRYMINSALNVGFPAESARHYENVDALLPELDNILKHGDLLYVKASHGIKLNLVVTEALR